MCTRNTASLILVSMLLTLLACAALPAAPATLDLTNAVVMTMGDRADRVERQAAVMLRTEVFKRTGINWREVQTAPTDSTPIIVVGSLAHMPEANAAAAGLPNPVMKDGALAADGFVLCVNTTLRDAPTVYAIGNDRRGTLYAVGRLLRALHWWPGRVEVEAGISLSEAPATRMRGMQLGYRHKADTYDAWDLSHHIEYVRDLILFGNNAIELIPALAPGAVEPANPGPLNPVTPWDLTVALCAVLDSYDMDVWFWIPLEGAETPEGREKALREREVLFASCQRIDNIFVPGADPGDTPPQILMPFLRDLTEVLHKHHPNAGMWVSNQGFVPEDLDWFYKYLQDEQPDWLAGVVYGPWTKDTLQHTREAVPDKYPVRRYPDVTHTKNCQYPFPNWDEAWTQVYDRQPIMPRPMQSAHTCNVLRQYADGAIAYSDGTGDDVNKIIWNVAMWNPKADIRSALIQLGRYSAGPDVAEGYADGILMLEKNWTQPALTSPQVPKTLAHWQALEARATPQAMASWRFQQGLLRAYVDAYVQARAKQETPLLELAYAELAKAPQMGADPAMDAAEAILKRANPLTAAPPLRARIIEIADMLHESNRMQLSMAKHGASSIGRGALLDSMDRPLTDGAWLLLQFPTIREMADEQVKLAEIDRLVNWEDPGPGGFYDDLGNGVNGKQPHLVLEPGWEKDPGYVISAQDEHGGPNFPNDGRMSWVHQGQTLYWTPLKMRYIGLDRTARYTLRYVPGGRFNPALQLYLDGAKTGDPMPTDRRAMKVVEVEVPQSATADGTLEVMWEKAGIEGYLAGRGAQVAEVWLIKKQ